MGLMLIGQLDLFMDLMLIGQWIRGMDNGQYTEVM